MLHTTSLFSSGHSVPLDDGGFGAAHRAVVGHVVNDDGASTDVDVVADVDVADDDGARTDAHVVADNRAVTALVADGHQLVNHAVLADGARADHGTETMLNIESATELVAWHVKPYRYALGHQESHDLTQVTDPVEKKFPELGHPHQVQNQQQRARQACATLKLGKRIHIHVDFALVRAGVIDQQPYQLDRYQNNQFQDFYEFYCVRNHDQNKLFTKCNIGLAASERRFIRKRAAPCTFSIFDKSSHKFQHDKTIVDKTTPYVSKKVIRCEKRQKTRVVIVGQTIFYCNFASLYAKNELK